MNAGHFHSWDYDHLAMHGALQTLSAGSHLVEVQYKVPFGTTVTFFDDTNGEYSGRLTAALVPTTSLVTNYTSPTSVSDSPQGTSTAWASLPGDRAMSLIVESSGDGACLFFADVARIQCNTGNRNVALRIVVDGEEVALMNAGHSQSWDYDGLAMHGALQSLSAGSHIAEVQYKVQSGTVTFYDDTNGEYSGRLTGVKKAWHTAAPTPPT